MQMRKRNKRLIWVLSLVAVVVIAAAGFWLIGKQPFGSGTAKAGDADSVKVAVADDDQDAARDGKDGEPEEVPVPVELGLVQRRPIAAFYRAASVIEANRLVDLVTKVQGRVQTIYAEEGDWVETGEIMAELENSREKIQLRQSELKLAEQERLLERNRSMLSEELISRQVYDDSQNAYDLTEADRDLARIALEETIIRAPFAGQLTDRKIVLGQHVNMLAPLFTLADFQPLRVRVHLPEIIARKVSAGQRVLVYPEAVSEPIAAIVERVAPVVDPATSTVRLTLRLEENQNQSRVGGFVKVRITTESHLEALAVPKLALVEEGGLRSVFVAAADTVRKVEVRTGLYDESHVEVLDGVDEGDFIVTLGQGSLRTGSLIEPLNGADVGWPQLSSAGQFATGEVETTLARTPNE